MIVAVLSVEEMAVALNGEFGLAGNVVAYSLFFYDLSFLKLFGCRYLYAFEIAQIVIYRCTCKVLLVNYSKLA